MCNFQEDFHSCIFPKPDQYLETIISTIYWANGSVNYKFCFDTNAICWQKIAEPLILHLEWLIIGWYFLQLQLCNMHFILFGAVLQEIHLQATKWFDIEILGK